MRSLPAVLFLGALSAFPPTYADEADARDKVKEAFAAGGKEPQATYEAARQAVTDSSFGALETGTQHAALVLAYTAAYKAKDFDRAHEFASRASSLPEQNAHFASVARNEPDKLSQAEQRAKALKFYEETVQLEPGDLKSWYGMSGLVFDMHDVPYAKAFIPRFTAVRAEHANIGGLAGSLASLYSMVGDNDTAMKYALAWQKHSISSQDKENATASITRLKSANERKQAADGISAPDAHPRPSP